MLSFIRGHGDAPAKAGIRSVASPGTLLLNFVVGLRGRCADTLDVRILGWKIKV